MPKLPHLGVGCVRSHSLIVQLMCGKDMMSQRLQQFRREPFPQPLYPSHLGGRLQ